MAAAVPGGVWRAAHAHVEEPAELPAAAARAAGRYAAGSPPPRSRRPTCSLGSGISILRSSRPGRMRAGSSTSGRLVAATSFTLPSFSNPSSWDSSSISVRCTCSPGEGRRAAIQNNGRPLLRGAAAEQRGSLRLQPRQRAPPHLSIRAGALAEALAANGIDLIHEDDAGLVLPCIPAARTGTPGSARGVQRAGSDRKAHPAPPPSAALPPCCRRCRRQSHPNISRITRADSPMYLSTTPEATTCRGRAAGQRGRAASINMASLVLSRLPTALHVPPQSGGLLCGKSGSRACLEEVCFYVGGDGLGQQRLAGAGRPVQQHPRGRLDAHPRK